MTWALLRPKTAVGTISGGDGTEKGEASPDPHPLPLWPRVCRVSAEHS